MCLGWFADRSTAGKSRCLGLRLGGNGRIGDVNYVRSAACDVRDNVRVLAQPAVSSNFK